MIGSRPLAEVYEIIEDFVREDYLSNWFASPRLIRRHFADPLDYYWGRTGSTAERRHAGQDGLCITLAATLFSADQRHAGSDEVRRTIPIFMPFASIMNSRPSARGTRKAGLGQTSLLLELFDKRVMIRGEGGKVLERY